MKQYSGIEINGMEEWLEKVKKTTKGQDVKNLEKLTRDGITIPLISMNDVENQKDEHTKDFFIDSTQPQLWMSSKYLNEKFEGVDIFVSEEKTSDDYVNVKELRSEARVAGQAYHLISTYPLHQSGVPVQYELAFIFSAVEEWIRERKPFFTTKSERLLIHLPTDQHFITEIAKFDSLRNGLYTIFSEEGFSTFPGIIITSPSTRRWSSLDHEMNLLRLTNSVTLAALSGIGTIHTIPYDEFSVKGASKRGIRLARTIPYLVWEEARLLPSTYATDSWTIKEVSEKIYELSWDIYHCIEENGGVSCWIQNQEQEELCLKYQAKTAEDVLEGRVKLVGSNIYFTNLMNQFPLSTTEFRWSDKLEQWQGKMHSVTYSLSKELSAEDAKQITTIFHLFGLKKVETEFANLHVQDYINNQLTLVINKKVRNIPVVSTLQLIETIWKELA
ncbi:methylmalonyl-CoA mutase family protein [Mangrovibacillus cuniculi]|uniref:Methylmalonyl-CoA mutase alpha/beta chain catalytic domain-containing protein n=1 Tax=Mangrovibacillus cuniculi TaxID=2593652 RepID=A0A7S8CBA8_9BACI|nr:methylmalonyl-CoA mutase family protein [Mangrovibacillus cuniculi]QPC46803.1 hypothetical protein G8O30_07420 [Mangrovibacillus cuniculi]